MKASGRRGFGFFRRAARNATLAGLVLLTGVVAGHAQVASDRASAIVVFPKMLVDAASGLDTFVRLSNASNKAQNVQCFYTNVTPHCVGGGPDDTCFPDPSQCGGRCQSQWQETDFQVRLTARQPTAWLVSEGAVDCQFLDGVCSDNPAVTCVRDSGCAGRCVLPPCFRLDGFFRNGPGGQTNEGSRIPPAPEEPFIGELKCIAVDESGAPVGNNALKGEVLIGRVDAGSGFVDVESYNGIGIRAIEGAGNRDNTLVLGGPRGIANGSPCTVDAQCGPNPDLACVGGRCDHVCRRDGNCAEYEGCPNILILNHFFDGAVDPLATGVANGARVGTDLTLVPCTEDFRTQDPTLSRTVAQFLVFNEFEQRFSTSTTVDCFKEIRLSNLETRQNERSIFSAGVAGTLTGQTRIRGVVDGADDHGNTLLGIAEEFRCAGTGFPLCGFTSPNGMVGSASANLHMQGSRPERDFLYLP